MIWSAASTRFPSPSRRPSTSTATSWTRGWAGSSRCWGTRKSRSAPTPPPAPPISSRKSSRNRSSSLGSGLAFRHLLTRWPGLWARKCRNARPDPGVPWRASMPSVTRVRVRYKDTDTMSVVYYGNYLTYFEVGRVEYLREYGWPMSRVNERVHLPVVEAFVKYVKPARLDELLEITSPVSERQRASFRFAYEIHNEAPDLIATRPPPHPR